MNKKALMKELHFAGGKTSVYWENYLFIIKIIYLKNIYIITYKCTYVL